MDKIIVQGGNTRLSGEVVIEGAKTVSYTHLDVYKRQVYEPFCD